MSQPVKPVVPSADEVGDVLADVAALKATMPTLSNVGTGENGRIGTMAALLNAPGATYKLAWFGCPKPGTQTTSGWTMGRGSHAGKGIGFTRTLDGKVEHILATFGECAEHGSPYVRKAAQAVAGAVNTKHRAIKAGKAEPDAVPAEFTR